MNITDKDRKYILTEHLRNIAHISDEEYQGRVWIRGEGPEVNDFDETVCHFFDDGDPILNNYKIYGITDTQYHLLMKLRASFEAFVNEPKSYFPEDFLNTAEWKNIMVIAKNVLKSFGSLI